MSAQLRGASFTLAATSALTAIVFYASAQRSVAGGIPFLFCSSVRPSARAS